MELAIELGALGRPLEATSERGVAALAHSDVTAVLLPASALFLGRPMPPGRALVEAGAAVALATDFNPGSAFCESLPIVASLASTQLGLSPAQALSAMTVNAATSWVVPSGRDAWRRGTTQTSSCSMPPTGATSPTTSGVTWWPR